MEFPLLMWGFVKEGGSMREEQKASRVSNSHLSDGIS
jgi:hypothetical protein